MTLVFLALSFCQTCDNRSAFRGTVRQRLIMKVIIIMITILVIRIMIITTMIMKFRITIIQLLIIVDHENCREAGAG